MAPAQQSQSMMKLLDLPVDIINILPKYFNSIHDLYNVLLTCRTLWVAYRDTEISLPPILHRLYGQPLFQPNPHLLLTSVARQIGDWAVSSPSNRYELYQTLLTGYDGLLLLAERTALVSLSDLRHLHAIKYSVLNPLTHLVDFEVGPAMVRNQDMDPAEYGLTICQHPDIAVLNHLVYCELFHHYVDEILASAEVSAGEGQNRGDGATANLVENITTHENTRSDPSPRPLEAGIRHRFIAYCLPDPNNHRNKNYKSLGKGRDDEWQLLDYIEMSRSDALNRRDEALLRYWKTGILQAIPDDESVGMHGFHELDWRPSTAEKRESLFLLVARHLGYESLQMLLLDGLAGEKLEARLKEIRTRIQNIPKELIDRWEYWSHSDDPPSETPPDSQHYEREWHAWLGMASDCHEGISTNQESDQDLRDEMKACESLLKLSMSAEQLGIMDSGMQGQAKD